MLLQPIAPPPPASPADRVDVDFSLAIHNRTGKYFIGRDLLEMADLPVGWTFYWSLAANAPPSGLFGKVIGRLQLYHVKAHTLGGPMRMLRRRQSSRPILHLDPFTVPTTVLRRQDAVLCHDLGPLTHPHLFNAEVCRMYRPIYDEISRVGPHMIFVSEASRTAFESCYPGANPASVRCIYPAIRTGATRTAPQPLDSVSQPFLLTVGSIGSRKNQLRCIQAFARSGLAQAGISYVMCGPNEPGFEAVRAAADVTAGVICLPYVSDAELSWLYGSALGFVLVSQLEGFGMPVAEAIARGLVPLVTRDSVLQEVAGEGALLADAEDVDGISERMLALARMDDHERRHRMEQLNRAIQIFEVERIRNQWRAVFRDILESSHSI